MKNTLDGQLLFPEESLALEISFEEIDGCIGSTS
jgi:hypothetical protein